MTPTFDVQWDESKLRTLQPNLCCVFNSDDAISMLLANRDRNAASGPITVTEGDRILLTPVNAKLLAELLGDCVRRHEQERGPVESLVPTQTSEDDDRLADGPEMAEKAEMLVDLVNGLGVGYVHERSFKVDRRTLLPHRFMLNFRREGASPQALVALPGVCERLGMPPQFLAEFEENLPRTAFIFFGFEEGEHSSICKVYEEFAGPQDGAEAWQAALPVPVLSYVGYKWDVLDSRKAARATYTKFPGLSPQAMSARAERILDGPDSRSGRELANQFIGIASTRIPHAMMRYLEVAEEGNPRKSFDINAYGAGLLVAEFYPLFVRMCQRFEVGPGEFLPLYERIKMKEFGHVSGGVDREGRDFFTVYFGHESRGGP
jgi:hypothetical protein